jgi:hypothetical protein
MTGGSSRDVAQNTSNNRLSSLLEIPKGNMSGYRKGFSQCDDWFKETVKKLVFMH